METISERLKAYITFKNVSQRDFGESIGKSAGWVNNAGKSLKIETVQLIRSKYPDLNIEWLTTGTGSMLSPASDFLSSIVSEPVEKYDNTDQLEAIISRRKPKNSFEGTVTNPDDFVAVKTIVIPVKGAAGLKRHFFEDEYIEAEFEHTSTFVPKSEYAKVLYKIQADGNSMPPLISPGDYCICEPIPDLTLDYKFSQGKIYALFHHLRGILFKKAENLQNGMVNLISDNPDKNEYPDEAFHIGEFKKILIVRTIEKKV